MAPRAVSSASWIKEKEILSLKRVFASLDSARTGLVGEKELNAALLRIGYRAKPGEVADMIWEVDENCDGHVDWNEFASMFRRSMEDQTGLEPRGLFQVVEFMMHDADNGGTISQDELMEILFKRFGKDQLLERTQAFFPSKVQEGAADAEQAISFVEFRRFMHSIKPKPQTNRERARAIQFPG
jgi:calmodulin